MRLYRNTIQTSESALQHRTNMTASFLLHFVMLVWSVVTAAEFQLVPQAGEYDMVSEKPGFKIRVSQFGLNYGANIAVDVLSAKVLQIKIPDQNGSAKVPVVRQVYYAISNSQVIYLY